MTFYAHYDKNTGAILAVGGHKLPDEFPDALITEIDDDQALQFMNHELDISEWFIGVVPSSDKIIITQSMMNLMPHDAGTYMELPRGDKHAMGIRVLAVLSDDVIEFSIPDTYKGKKLDSGNQFETFTLTKRNDPTYVISTFEVDMDQLMDNGRLEFHCDLEFKDYSMFTTKRFHHYQFEVSSTHKSVGRKVSSARYNKLVVYRSGPTDAGVVATYDDQNNELILEVVGKIKLTWPSNDKCFILLTKPNDPSIIYHALPFNVDTFWQEKRVALQLPKDINQAFGVASFPLSSDLVFNRQSDGNRNKTDN